MRILSQFMGFLLVILVLRWAISPEAQILAEEILVKILTIIRDLLQLKI